LLIIVIGGSLALFAWRGPSMRNTGVFQPVSREGALLFNNLIMTTAAAAVLLGTLYPLFLDAIGGDKVSVGAPYFNTVFIPLMIPMMAAMAVGPMLGWKRADLGVALKRLRLAFILTVVAAITMWAFVSDGPVLAMVGLAMAVWLSASTLIELAERIRLFREPFSDSLKRLVRTPRASWGMTLGHLGLAIAVAGMAGAGGWKQEAIQTMSPGDRVEVGGYTFTFEGATEGRGPNYFLTRGVFQVTENGEPVVTLYPENRRYPVRSMPTTEAAIHTLFTGDLYAVIGDPEGGDGSYVTRIYWNPLIAWMWGGALIMAGAAGISLSDRRFRVGVARRRKVPVTTVESKA